MPDLDLDGRRLHYLDEGAGEPAICFVHGFPFQSEMWRPQVDHLAGRHRCLAPDLWGFGLSDVPAQRQDCTIGGYADQVAAVIEAAGGGPVVVAGLSMGGYVALDLVHRRPELLQGLVLADTRAEADGDEARQRRSDQQLFLAGGGERAELAGGLLTALISAHGPGRERALRLARAFMLSTPVEGWIGALEAMKNRDDATPWLAGIAVPSLVLVGEDDALTPVAAATVLAEGIPGAELVVLPGAGHLANLEHPAGCNDAFDGFLARMAKM